MITPEVKDDAVKTKGYFIYPSQLFANVAARAKTNESLNTDLAAIFASIESSANGYPSEQDIKGLFADFDTTSNRLGNTVKEKNACLAAVIKGVADLDFGKFENSHIDLFGEAYEYLISNYAANAGKSGGEFFTPHHVSRLIAQLAIHKQTSINKIYDPACGSGSLLLHAKKQVDKHIIEDGFFGQEINHTTYNLARMNMFLHNINYNKFNIRLGNTLTDPHFGDEKPFDAIVSNPPYSVKWIGADDPALINDVRFAPAGVLAPKFKADFAFVLHALSYLSSKGRAAIVCFPGIFYRGGAEQKIRQYLVDNNYVETVIALAPNLFFGTTITVNILVLSKHKTDTKTQFIDASSLFKKETNNNVLLDEHIEQIMQVFDSKVDVEHFAKSVPLEAIVAAEYNLSVSSYVEAKDSREVVDIAKLSAELEITVAKIDQLRKDIDAIVAEIEGGGLLHFEEGEVEWKTLGDIAEYSKTRISFEKVDAQNYVGVDNLLQNRAGKTDSSYVPTSGNLTRYIENDILIGNIRPYLKKIWQADRVGGTNGDVLVIRLTDKTVSSRYLYQVLSDDKFFTYNMKHAKGAKMPRGNKDKIMKYRFQIPKNPDEQAHIASILDKFDTLTNSISEGLPREIALRQKQYEYYRDLLFSFPKPEEVGK